MYLDDHWFLARGEAGTYPDTRWPADVSILQSNWLAPLLGVSDPRTSTRIDFVGGIRGTRELERPRRRGTARLAFSLYPTRVEPDDGDSPTRERSCRQVDMVRAEAALGSRSAFV